MTTHLEEHLAEGMREQTRGVTLTTDVLGRATKSHRRRTAVVRLGYGLGVIGIAGALAAGVAFSGGAPDRPREQAQAQEQEQARQSPALRLTNAATAGTSTSYRIRLQAGGWAESDGVRAPSGPPVTWEGAFDPTTATGYVKSPFEWGVTTELLINGTRYVGTEPRPDGKMPPGTHEEYSRYSQYKGTYDRLTYGDSEQPVVGAATPDPAGLLAALREANATVTEKPDGTLRFTYSTKADKGSQTHTGDVTLDAQGRIARMVVVTVWETTIKNRLDRGESTTTTEFSDWGLPVTVERPAKVFPAN